MSSGANGDYMGKMSMPIVNQKLRKTDVDVTPSGANGTSTTKVNMHIVISILENPRSQCFSDFPFLACADHCSILRQMDSYNSKTQKRMNILNFFRITVQMLRKRTPKEHFLY
ncbi:hypothetical protein PRIPAC_79024 [Pristionchus pacificus]|uniref:Uncharacterized protein n=1 Tax=Pristionchus pacificus TaxID=54126 RepID=A0A2A6CLY6_PRIPA|nr:hypothetical protein PRIPAC_79024 [Pristionchus pacificus]|eukprot:PDM79110.1 hypothetical protein PRIPAC_31689 [Pristionchus pacificus]